MKIIEIIGCLIVNRVMPIAWTECASTLMPSVS